MNVSWDEHDRLNTDSGQIIARVECISENEWVSIADPAIYSSKQEAMKAAEDWVRLKTTGNWQASPSSSALPVKD